MDRKGSDKRCQQQKHAEECLKPGSVLFLNGKQINILILPQLHFPNNFDLSSVTRMMSNHPPSVRNRMELCSSSSVSSTKAQLVHNLRSNMLPESSYVLAIETDTGLKILLDQQCVLSNFPLHHHDLVPGSNTIRADQIVNTNSEKRPCESKVSLHGKQDCTSVCTLKQVATVNNETKTDYHTTSRLQTLEVTGELSSITDNNMSACYDLDATVPSYDVTMTGCCPRYDLTEKHYPNQLCNCEEIPIVPESPNTCKTGLLAVTCMDTSYQDSNVPSNSPINESYCLTLCCFAAEKESLVDEESDYELNLSPTQESYLQQHDDNVDVSVIGSSQFSCHGEGHHDVSTSPAESVSKFDVIDTSADSNGLVDDGAATLLQELPLEKARQTDTEILQVCKRPTDSRENTDDDFDGNTGKTQKITSSQLPNQNFESITNNLYSESSTKTERFPMEQVDYDHASNNNNNNSNLQAVPSDDHSCDVDYDGPSKLLMAMELVQRKDHHVPGPLNACEGIFSGSNYLNMVSTTRLNLAKPNLRLGLSRRQRCKPLHPYYRAGTQ